MQRDPIDVERLRTMLGDRWNAVDVVDETASTNADLLARAADAPDRSLLAAEHQSAGRGRFERVWTSPPHAGLTFSVLLRPDVPLVQWGWLPLLAGVALAEAVRDTTGVDAALKWPNDLLAGPDRRKAAGILAQSAGDVVVIGIGLNVSTTAAELPVDTATSLAIEGAAGLDRTDLLAAILIRLDARLAQWSDCGGDPDACGLAAAYRGLSATIGADVRVRIADADAIEGTVSDIDRGGRLVVQTAAGQRTVAAGDVEQLRRA